MYASRVVRALVEGPYSIEDIRNFEGLPNGEDWTLHEAGAHWNEKCLVFLLSHVTAQDLNTPPIFGESRATWRVMLDYCYPGRERALLRLLAAAGATITPIADSDEHDQDGRSARHVRAYLKSLEHRSIPWLTRLLIWIKGNETISNAIGDE